MPVFGITPSEKTLQDAVIAKPTYSQVTALPVAEHVIAVTPGQKAAIEKLFAKKQTRSAVLQSNIKAADKIKPLQELVALLCAKTGFTSIRLQHSDPKKDIVVETVCYNLQAMNTKHNNRKSKPQIAISVSFTSAQLSAHWVNLFEALRLNDPFLTLSRVINGGMAVAGGVAAFAAYNIGSSIIDNRQQASHVHAFAQDLATLIKDDTDLFRPEDSTPPFVGHAETLDMLGNAKINPAFNIPAESKIVIITVFTQAGLKFLVEKRHLEKDAQLQHIKILICSNSHNHDFDTRIARETLKKYGWHHITLPKGNKETTRKVYSAPYQTSNANSFFTSTQEALYFIKNHETRSRTLAALGLTVNSTRDDICTKCREILARKGVPNPDTVTLNKLVTDLLTIVKKPFENVNLQKIYTSEDAIRERYDQEIINAALIARNAEAKRIEEQRDAEVRRQRAVAAAEERQQKAEQDAKTERIRAAEQAAEDLRRLNSELYNATQEAIEFAEKYIVSRFGATPSATEVCAGAGSSARPDLEGAHLSINVQVAAREDSTLGYVPDFAELHPETTSDVLIISAPFPGTIQCLQKQKSLHIDKQLKQIRVIVVPFTTFFKEELHQTTIDELKHLKWNVVCVMDNPEKCNEILRHQENTAVLKRLLRPEERLLRPEAWFKCIFQSQCHLTADSQEIIFDTPTMEGTTSTWKVLEVDAKTNQYAVSYPAQKSFITDTRDSVYQLLPGCGILTDPKYVATAVQSFLEKVSQPTEALQLRRTSSAQYLRFLCYTEEEFVEKAKEAIRKRCDYLLWKKITPIKILGFKEDSNPTKEEIKRAYKHLKSDLRQLEEELSKPEYEADLSDESESTKDVISFSLISIPLKKIAKTAYRILIGDPVYASTFEKRKIEVPIAIQEEREAIACRIRVAEYHKHKRALEEAKAVQNFVRIPLH